MKHTAPTAVIGAGPYGLAVSAYLKAAGVPTLTFGKPLELWRKMPEGLCLKSVWSASSLFEPTGTYNLDAYVATTGKPREEPISRQFFLDYTEWFQQQVALEIDQTYVQMLSRDKDLFRLGLADGREVRASRVIVATGIAEFARVPDYARHLPPTLAAHTQKLGELGRFKGQRVVMIGNGQSALEYAALLHEAGAEVEIIARGPFLWHSRILYERTGPARHILYPPGDVGPPGINWIVAFPLFFRQLPESLKRPLHRRATRPAGAKWLRPRVEGVVRLTPHTQVKLIESRGDGLRVKLSDGTQREIDFLCLGTGYQPDIKRVSFLNATLLQQIQERNGYPLLNSRFESSVPGLHFAGALAGHTFGPVCRFLSGASGCARQIARHAIHSDR
jgi:cation diffusion facilitator CzcD-associated flavoprotein CzcO